MKQYETQWTTWKDRTQKEADRRFAKQFAQMAGGRIPAGLAEVMRNNAVKEVRKEDPFNPKLSY